jgi:DNA-binding XRE family transcriptional regulator
VTQQWTAEVEQLRLEGRGTAEIAETLREKGASQRDVASAIGIGRTTLRRILGEPGAERTKREPRAPRALVATPRALAASDAVAELEDDDGSADNAGQLVAILALVVGILAVVVWEWRERRSSAVGP